MLTVAAIDTRERAARQAFLGLPFRLYRGNPNWAPVLADDAARMLDRRRHPFYQHSDAQFLLARRDDAVIGRLAVLDNAHYNDYNHTQANDQIRIRRIEKNYCKTRNSDRRVHEHIVCREYP